MNRFRRYSHLFLVSISFILSSSACSKLVGVNISGSGFGHVLIKVVEDQAVAIDCETSCKKDFKRKDEIMLAFHPGKTSKILDIKGCEPFATEVDSGVQVCTIDSPKDINVEVVFESIEEVENPILGEKQKEVIKNYLAGFEATRVVEVMVKGDFGESPEPWPSSETIEVLGNEVISFEVPDDVDWIRVVSSPMVSEGDFLVDNTVTDYTEELNSTFVLSMGDFESGSSIEILMCREESECNSSYNLGAISVSKR